MSLLWIEGFEGIGSTNADAQAAMPQKYTCINTTTWVADLGRVNGSSIKGKNFPSASSFETPSLGNVVTVIVGWAWQRPASDVAHKIIELRESTNIGVNVRLKSTGEFEVYNNNTLLATTSGADIGSGTWAYFQLKVKVDNSVGTYELKINGTIVASDGGSFANTEPNTNNYINTVRFSFTTNPSAVTTHFDDIYICDATGSANNDYLGDSYIEGIYPSGAGDSTQFTPDSGSNYARVNENPPDNDTSYVEDSTSGHQDLYAYAAASPTITNTIYGVQINSLAKGSGFSLKNDCKSGGSVSSGSGVSLGSGYGTVVRILETDPATSVAWTPTGLGSAQFGVEVG